MDNDLITQYNLSLIIPYYNHPEFLKFQLNLWNSYSDKVKNEMEIILVDDGSETSIVNLPNLPEFPKNLKIYRILEDIPWNEKGARNLGAKVATTSWLLHTDFDHWFDSDNLEKLIDYRKNRKEFYRFKRVRGGSLIHQHKETHVVYRKYFLKIGGFDEDFSGHWGSGAYTLYFKLLTKFGCTLKELDLFVNSECLDNHKDCQCKIDKTRMENEKELLKNKSKLKASSQKTIRFNWKKVL